MQLIPSRELWQRVKRTQWRFQATCSTPWKHLGAFGACLVEAVQPLQEASLLVHVLVDVPHLRNACADAFAIESCDGHFELRTDSELELALLLEAGCSDMIDFYLVPRPKRFLMFCDHDGFVTFFANTKSHLNAVRERLKRIPVAFKDYEREFP